LAIHAYPFILKDDYTICQRAITSECYEVERKMAKDRHAYEGVGGPVGHRGFALHLRRGDAACGVSDLDRTSTRAFRIRVRSQRLR
jgi:hypothetical protein